MKFHPCLFDGSPRMALKLQIDGSILGSESLGPTFVVFSPATTGIETLVTFPDVDMNQNHGELVEVIKYRQHKVWWPGAASDRQITLQVCGGPWFPEKDMGTVIAITSRNEIFSIPDKLFKLFPRKLLYPGEKMMVGKD